MDLPWNKPSSYLGTCMETPNSRGLPWWSRLPRTLGEDSTATGSALPMLRLLELHDLMDDTLRSKKHDPNGGVQKWGYPKMVGLSWTIRQSHRSKWMMTGGTPISGNQQTNPTGYGSAKMFENERNPMGTRRNNYEILKFRRTLWPETR